MELKKLLLENSSLKRLFHQGRDTLYYEEGKKETLVFIEENKVVFEGVEFAEKNDKEFEIYLDSGLPVRVSNCIFKTKIYIKGSGIRELSFGNVVFEGGLDINGNIGRLIVSNCKTPFSFSLAGHISNSIEINECSFTELNIGSIIATDFILRDVFVNSNFSLGGGLTKGAAIVSLTCSQLILNLANIHKIFCIENSEIEEILFNRNNFHEDFIITNSQVGGINFSQARFKGNINLISSIFNEEVSFSFKESYEGKVGIGSHSRINSLNVTGELSSKSSFDLSNSSFKSISFRYFKNSGSLKLTDLHMERNSSFILTHCNMGKAEMHNNNFSKSIFEFDKSHISELFISETEFPEKVYKGGEIDFAQGKLAFGQLQTVFQKQGDTVRSYEYLAREVECYYHQLKWVSKMFFTKFSLFLNYISNNFGRNWILGFIFSFAIGFIFYYFLILSSNEFVFGIPVKIDWSYTSSFLKFMNPLRHFETENLFQVNTTYKLPITLSNYSYVWDFLGRIFVAYGYYQTIQAFRKFGRRSS